MAFERSASLVAIFELLQCLLQLLDGPEGVESEDLLLRCADEALGTTIAFFGKGQRAAARRSLPRRSCPGDLVPEISSRRYHPSDLAEGSRDRRAASPCRGGGLTSSPPPSPMAPKCSPTPWRIGSNASKRTPRVVACFTCATRRARRTTGDRHEDADPLPGTRNHRCHVGAPYLVDPRRHDDSIMSPRPPLRPSAWLGERIVLAHPLQNPRLRCVNLLVLQARPYPAIALAIEGIVRDHLPDLFDRFRIGHRPASAGSAARGLVDRLRFQTASPPERLVFQIRLHPRDTLRFFLWRKEMRVLIASTTTDPKDDRLASFLDLLVENSLAIVSRTSWRAAGRSSHRGRCEIGEIQSIIQPRFDKPLSCLRLISAVLRLRSSGR